MHIRGYHYLAAKGEHMDFGEKTIQRILIDPDEA